MSFFLYPELAKRLKDPNEIITEELPKLNITWNAEDCLVKSATNSFGKIDFNVEQVGGKKPAKVSFSEHVSSVLVYEITITLNN